MYSIWRYCALLCFLLPLFADAAALLTRGMSHCCPSTNEQTLIMPLDRPRDGNTCPPTRGVICGGVCCPSSKICNIEDLCVSKPPPRPTPGNIYFTRYFDSEPQVCSGDVCQTTPSLGPYVRVHGSGFSGIANVGVYPAAGGNPIWYGSSKSITSWDLDTTVLDCGPNASGNLKKVFVTAYDTYTKLWSNRVEFYVGCRTW